MSNLLYNLATDKYCGPLAAAPKFFLFLLSLVYGAVIRCLIFFSGLNQRKLGCKVISVGNITLGGTGKTVLVEYIARFLKGQGRKVAILSRGYKNADEPQMLKQKLGDVPVIVDADRVRGAEHAIKDYGADIVILDDGFQQWGIKKDLEIVCVDAGNPFGNANMIPRGILREPLSSLERADVFVMTKTNQVAEISRTKAMLFKYNPYALTLESTYEPEVSADISALRDKPVALFSGIGDPDSFEKSVEALGIKIGLLFKFSDHHNYSPGDLDKIFSAAKDKGCAAVVTTEKDAARIGKTQYELQVLRINLVIRNQERFHARLLKLYSL